MNKVVETYMNMEVERLTNNIINQGLHETMAKKDYNNLLIVQKNTKDEIEKISYDTKKINNLTNDISSYMRKFLYEIDSGKIEDFLFLSHQKNKFTKIKNGIILDVSLGNVYHSVLFSNVGPTIPIKLVFSGQMNTDVDIVVKEYGINNVIIEMFFVVEVREIATMPISSKKKTIKIREPLSIDIIKGEIPKYYSGVLS